MATRYSVTATDILTNTSEGTYIVTSPTYTFTNLIPGDIYQLTVNALDSTGNSLGTVTQAVPMVSFVNTPSSPNN